MSTINTGVSLFSFTNEWRLGQYTLQSLVEAISTRAIGPGFEIVGFQSLRGYPRLGADEVLAVRRLIDKYRRVPTSLATNTDTMRRRDRPLTEEEKISDLEAQMDLAVSLGFPLVRIQMAGATKEGLQVIAKSAERRKLRVGIEIHAPEGGETALVQRLLGYYREIGSDALGFVADFSSTMHALPSGQLRAFVQAGLPQALVPVLLDCWARDDLETHARFALFEQRALAAGAPPAAVAGVRIGFHMFGRQLVPTWNAIMDRIFHVHGKFYEIDAAGNEPNIDYGKILPLFRAAGYKGWFSSEWEGTAFTLASEVNALDIVELHHALMRRAWGD